MISKRKDGLYECTECHTHGPMDDFLWEDSVGGESWECPICEGLNASQFYGADRLNAIIEETRR